MNIAEYESAIWNNAESFTTAFAHSKQPEELIGVWFSTESVKFNYMLECGQHITYDCRMSEFLEWLKTTLDITPNPAYNERS